MKTKKIRIETITETEREILFRIERRRTFSGTVCGICAGALISINEAVRETNHDWRDIVRFIKNGRIHWIETAKGEIYVCAESLKKQN